MTEHELPAGYSERLWNKDLAPLKERPWGWYQIFCMWMSDVHSVGGYLFAASLFALGLAAWQVLLCLLIGIVMVMFFTNLIARAGVDLGAPFPVVCRLSFGVLGANIPAIIRGVIAVAWYGIQTYVASKALIVVVLKFFPQFITYEHMHFLGLSYLGWFAFMTMWFFQFLVFQGGMKTITHFIDWAGPGVYVVMFILAGWIVHKAGWENINLTLGDVKYTGWAAAWQMLVAIALVVSYFSGPMVNFSDFSRFARSMSDVKKGNFWGHPVNYLAFAIVTVITTSGTMAVFGEYIHDPIDVVARIDNTTAAIIGAATFLIATIGINIVANFVGPAYAFSSVAPKHITFKLGGLITAFAAMFVMPWHLFNSPAVIHYTLGTLGAAIGPLYGILVADYWIVKHAHLLPDDLYSDKPTGHYWYKNGYNPIAIKALIAGAVVGMLFVFIPALQGLSAFSWFIGVAVGGGTYVWLMRRDGVAQARDERARRRFEQGEVGAAGL
ncbi:MAG: NCS1 family nucleobase:cation symporter-1 [Burkholderiales bacterium]